MEKVNRYPHVFSPLKLKNLTLRNRIQFSPMVSCLTTASGEVTTEYCDFIAMQARTGAALVTIGASGIDEENGFDCAGELNITRDEYIGGLARIAEASHRHGAKISAEMIHAGRNADPMLTKTPYAIAPTPMPLPGRIRFVKEMDQLDIDRVVKCYADCAYRLYEAGFDMCMIHGAHGNMVGSFLSPAFNFRTDCYGGSPENRMRFPLEILEAIRNRCGNKIAVEFRISGDEIIPGGARVEDAIAFLRKAQDYLDLVVVSRGLIVDRNYEFYTQPPYYNGYAHNVPYAEKIKKAIDIPVSVVGSIKTVEMAEEILAAGKADVIAMARQLMCDPNMLKNARRGEPEKTKPCLRCLQVCNKNTAMGIPISCAVSPELGFESKYSVIYKSPEPKKCVIVGGGVAGMMAAQTLVKRGHTVTLIERNASLGGRLLDIASLPFKEDLRQYREWDIRTTMACGAKILLNTKATPELIEAEAPDVLFLATGGRLITPDIPGIDGANVVDVCSVDSGRADTGDRVVVCGGGMSGLECALGLAMQGKKVSVIDMLDPADFASEIFFPTKNMLFMLLKKHGVKLLGNRKVERVTESGVETIDRNWKHEFFEADTVVTAFGVAPNRDDFEELQYLVPDTYIIGDCDDAEKSIGYANYSAFHNTVVL